MDRGTELSRAEVKMSRFISLVLRHRPEAAGISVDSHGWADIDALLAGCASHGRPLDRETLERIVVGNNKKRFAISADGRRIRARQGHSIPVDLDLSPERPPEILYHGTARSTLPAIFREGIRRMNRNHVHLSADYETAVQVGRRHGQPAVLAIQAGAMARAGAEFFCSENGVWLVDHVPPAFVSEIGKLESNA